MSRKSEPNRIPNLEKLVTGLPASEYVLNVTVLYHDAQTRSWANEVYQKVQRVVGTETVRGSWWKLADLGEPGVLAGAVSRSIHSDMIVIAVNESEGLPLPFYFWINAWLPHRVPGLGAIVGLLGPTRPDQRETGRLKKYLRAAANRTRMDLLLAERDMDAEAQLPSPRLALRGSRFKI
jgi:hypothetical protein